MAERIKRLYDNGNLTKTEVMNAVDMGLITASEYEKIVGEKLK